MYDGLIAVDEFVNKYESEVSEQQRFNTLKWALCTMPSSWWGTQQHHFEDWNE